MTTERAIFENVIFRLDLLRFQTEKFFLSKWINYTPKPSSRITPSIGENRMKIRSVDFESIEYRQTDTHTFNFIYRGEGVNMGMGVNMGTPP